MKLIYIAGPYRAPTEYGVHQNIRRAELYALLVWKAGAVAICPHLNTRFFGGALGMPDETWLKGDLEILSRCDAIFLVPGWEQSSGSKGELRHAQALGLKVLFSRFDLDTWLEEERRG